MPTVRPVLVFAALVLVTACTRALPGPLPQRSAASLEATAATPVEVGVALREDPPLPGEPTGDWSGLESTPSGASSVHGGHHAH